MKDYVAIDFETANPKRNSACAIGIAVVENNKLVESFSSNLCPPILEFNRFNVRVHGLTEEDVKHSPKFCQIWPHLKSIIENKTLVAHNAPFDISVLSSSALQAGIELPSMQYFCTLNLSKKLLPGLPNHRLGTLAKLFGINLDHHDAGSDAQVCAELAIRLCAMADSINYKFEYNKLHQQITSKTIVPNSKVQLSKSIEVNDDLISPAEPDKRFENKKFVFTGDMCYLSRSEAENIVEIQGGRVIGSVSSKTDYLVVGNEVWQNYQTNNKHTRKLKKAFEVKLKCNKIQIIPEDDFYGLIEDE